MSPVVEARIVEIRRGHPMWGSDRIRYQMERDGICPVPGRTSVYRALVRHGLVVVEHRRRRRADYRRWERGRPMELWQMDVVGGFHLVDGTELKAVSGIDDNSRFVTSAMLVRRATAGPARCVRRCWRRCGGTAAGSESDVPESGLSDEAGEQQRHLRRVEQTAVLPG